MTQDRCTSGAFHRLATSAGGAIQTTEGTTGAPQRPASPAYPGSATRNLHGASAPRRGGFEPCRKRGRRPQVAHQRLFRPDHSPARTSRAPRLYGVSAVRPSAVRLRRHTIGSRTDDTKRSAKSIRAPPRHRDSGGSRRADTSAWSLSSASALIPHTVRIILS